MSEMITVTIERTTLDRFTLNRISPDHLLRCADLAVYGPDAVRREGESTDEWIERLLDDAGVLAQLITAHGSPDETEVDETEWYDLKIE